MDNAIPDLKKLVKAVMAGATHRESFIHGESHWKCVAWTGMELCRENPEADQAVVFLFGLLHDSQRLNDGHDVHHGRRAGTFARKLGACSAFLLPAERLEILVTACDDHAKGFTTADATIGTCWDADRLNLWRVGTRPDPRFLSSSPAKSPARIQAASQLAGQRMSWEGIFAEMAKLTNASEVGKR